MWIFFLVCVSTHALWYCPPLQLQYMSLYMHVYVTVLHLQLQCTGGHHTADHQKRTSWRKRRFRSGRTLSPPPPPLSQQPGNTTPLVAHYSSFISPLLHLHPPLTHRALKLYRRATCFMCGRTLTSNQGFTDHVTTWSNRNHNVLLQQLKSSILCPVKLTC